MTGNIVVVVITAAVLAWIWWKADRPTAIILTAAYLVRLLVFYADIYQLVANPFSGEDTENFHAAAIAFLSENGPIKTNYTYVLAAIYRVFGSYGRFAAQFLNVLMSFGTVLLSCWALRMMEIPRKWRMIAVSVVAFMPATVCLSGILLREAWIQFFLMLSVCCFVRWHGRGGVWNEMACLLATFAVMLMHAGCVGALVAYIIGFVVCRTWKSDGVRTYMATLGVAVGFMLVMILVPELLLTKFTAAASAGDVVDVVPVVAGSTYLLWMQKLGVGVRLLLSPVRMFYLLFSPLPTDWRGLSDVVVFCVDSLVYLVLAVMMFWPPLLGKERQLRRFISYAVLLMTFVFALGTSNAGTAVRHRAKFLPAIALVAACSRKEELCEPLTPNP